jgi:hypothetical protein
MPGRTTCPDCGATIDLVHVRVSGEHGGKAVLTVPLDIAEEPESEADRYRIISHEPLIAEKVLKGSRGMTDHRWDCPGYNAGKRDRTR